MKTSRLLLACLMLATAPAVAQNVATQRTETVQTTNAGGTTRIATNISESQYIDQLRQVYTSAGIEASKIARLLDLDRKIYTAWTAGDTATIQIRRKEQRSLLAPNELEKVYVYYQTHPLPAGFPAFIVNTWAPANVYSTDIVLGPSTATGTTIAPA